MGASLREARILLRRSLPDVARDLRIRHTYLLAIEEGRLEDLPGVAYQTGFLRAYGNYLGLDGDGLAEDLKEARDASGDRDPLQMFSPIDEGHLPTRSIFLLAALLAIAVYGVWYFVSNTDGDPVERVAALPDRLAGLLDDEPAEKNPATVVPPSRPAPGSASPTPEPKIRDGNVQSGGETVPAASSAPESSTRPVEPSDAPPPAEPVAETTAPDPTDEAPPATPTAEARPAEPVAEPAPSETASESPPAEPVAGPPADAPPEDGGTRTPPVQPVQEENEADPPVEIAATTLPAPARPVGEVPGTTRETSAADVQEEAAASRIVLRAATESWIEIRTDDASLVYSGLLRQGQSYSVPERPGLKMVTGNAGGLEIVVDGEAIPRLGPPGAVVRDIALDPDSLRGRANP
ncbi:MAG: DUF4115 domain-containing protein [Defluviicoccus sp.]|nr:DUF4115 domain-containing protein [Defluviicoccus sp.]MDE0278885.1 DUF4115 domain-containing protein [Defluviicoccus sp.]